MGRPLRDTDPCKIHHISCRTRGAEILLVPSPKVNDLVGGVIAKYLAKYRVDLYSLKVLSNHYHMMVRAPHGNLPLFIENVNREIAKRMNWYLNRKGSFWGRRYDDQIVLEVPDSLECLLYILTNSVKHYQTSQAKSWPGVSTFWQTLGRKPQKYTFMNYTAYNKAKQRAAPGEQVRRRDFEEEYELKTKTIPFIENLEATEQIKLLRKEIEKRTRILNDKRRRERKGYLGRAAVLSQPAQGTFPKNVNTSKRPTCYTKSAEAKRTHDKEEKARRESYSLASVAYRLGNFLISFPKHCLYPPRHHIPKSHHLVPT